jgi:hypothetical protein
MSGPSIIETAGAGRTSLRQPPTDRQAPQRPRRNFHRDCLFGAAACFASVGEVDLRRSRTPVACPTI